jgi:sorting nexin-1/2
MGDAYVTLPLGEDSAGYPNEHEPSAPEQAHAPQPPAFLPRPPATAPIGMAEAQPASKFDVHVVEPTKSGSGYNAFVAYKVVCRTTMENYMSNDIAVNRRFNHFVWLHVQLTEQYPCYFIPVLPDKSGIDPYFNRFDAEFIERRRWALQQFLFRVVQHPILMASKPLQIFFEGDENQMRLPEDKKPSLFGGLFKDMGPKPPKAIQDPEFVEMGQYVKDFEAQLFEVHKFMERLVTRRKELGSSLGELGLTLITMGTREEKTGEPEAASASKSFHDLGSCCDHLAISIQEQVKDEMQKAVFVLEEWLRIVEGVKESLRTQAAAAGMYFALQVPAKEP